MSNPEIDIIALAKLARLEVSDAEFQKLQKELPGILEFVDAIQKADTSGVEVNVGLHNVMREDTEPHESGIYTKRLLDAAPAQKDDQVAVKQVVSRKK